MRNDNYLLKTNSHFTKCISFGRYLWGINHRFFTVTFDVYIIWQQKSVFIVYFDCPRIGQPIHRRNKFNSKRHSIFPFWHLEWPRKGKKQPSPPFANCGLVYCLSNIQFINFMLLLIKIPRTCIYCINLHLLLITFFAMFWCKFWRYFWKVEPVALFLYLFCK